MAYTYAQLQQMYKNGQIDRDELLRQAEITRRQDGINADYQRFMSNIKSGAGNLLSGLSFFVPGSKMPGVTGAASGALYQIGQNIANEVPIKTDVGKAAILGATGEGLLNAGAKLAGNAIGAGKSLAEKAYLLAPDKTKKVIDSGAGAAKNITKKVNNTATTSISPKTNTQKFVVPPNSKPTTYSQKSNANLLSQTQRKANSKPVLKPDAKPQTSNDVLKPAELTSQDMINSELMKEANSLGINPGEYITNGKVDTKALNMKVTQAKIAQDPFEEYVVSYHGSPKKFTSFDDNMFNDSNAMIGKGVYTFDNTLPRHITGGVDDITNYSRGGNIYGVSRPADKYYINAQDNFILQPTEVQHSIIKTLRDNGIKDDVIRTLINNKDYNLTNIFDEASYYGNLGSRALRQKMTDVARNVEGPNTYAGLYHPYTGHRVTLPEYTEILRRMPEAKMEKTHFGWGN